MAAGCSTSDGSRAVPPSDDGQEPTSEAPECFCPLTDEHSIDRASVGLGCFCAQTQCPARQDFDDSTGFDCSGSVTAFGSWGPYGGYQYVFDGDRLIGIYLYSDYPAYCGALSLSVGELPCMTPRPVVEPDPFTEEDVLAICGAGGARGESGAGPGGACGTLCDACTTRDDCCQSVTETFGDCVVGRCIGIVK